MNHKTKNSTSGFGLIEMIIGSAVLSVSLLGISNFFQSTLRTSGITQSLVQGDYLLEEGMETMKLFRDTSYADYFKNMSTTTTYYLTWNGTTWATTTANTFVDGKFERKFTLTDVKRDANSDISTSGTYDPDIKLITMSVAWNSPVVGTTTRLIKAYVLNIFNN
ncbi:MAG: hypothetical protein WBC83_03435 [Minisyncoccia bacterium]